MNTYTFQTKDKEFTITVKKEFLKICPTPELYTAHELCLHHMIIGYFHNQSGPAIIRHLDGHEEHWIDGECVETEPNYTKEDREKFFHKLKFNKKLDNI